MCDIKRTKMFDYGFGALISVFITKISTHHYFADGNSRHFPYLRLVTNRNILSDIYALLQIEIFYRGAMDSMVALQSLVHGFASRWPQLFFLKFFLLLSLQSEFNINLLSLHRFSYFFTPYDAQASSAYSALIIKVVFDLYIILGKFR